MHEPQILVPNATRSLIFGLCCHLLLCGVFIPMLGIYIAALGPLLMAFAGLMAGISAIRVIQRDPETFTGMGLAIAGTVISAFSMLGYGAFTLFVCFGMIMSFA